MLTYKHPSISILVGFVVVDAIDYYSKLLQQLNESVNDKQRQFMLEETNFILPEYEPGTRADAACRDQNAITPLITPVKTVKPVLLELELLGDIDNIDNRDRDINININNGDREDNRGGDERSRDEEDKGDQVNGSSNSNSNTDAVTVLPTHPMMGYQDIRSGQINQINQINQNTGIGTKAPINLTIPIPTVNTNTNTNTNTDTNTTGASVGGGGVSVESAVELAENGYVYV